MEFIKSYTTNNCKRKRSKKTENIIFMVKSLICPPFLKKGDKVAIIAMASKLERADIDFAINLMEKEWGLSVVVGSSVGSVCFDFAGTDEVRQRDFQRMLDDKEVKAIFSARGGYGSSRFIDKIDFGHFMENPKWVVGFSDITAVHGTLQALGYQSLHAPMPKTFFRDLSSVQQLKSLLFGDFQGYSIAGNKQNQSGKAEGQIVGGNLCLIAHSIGSLSELDTAGKILFIEDISEYLYNIDRMMVQLKRAGKLHHLSGLIVGDFSDVKDNDSPFGKGVEEIILEHTASFNYPICFGFPAGHEAINYPLVFGRKSTLIVGTNEVSLTFERAINE